MDDIIEFVIEVFGELVETILDSIKNTKKRKWALTIFYSAIVLLVCGVVTWLAIDCYLDQNTMGALACAVVAGALFLVSVFLSCGDTGERGKTKGNSKYCYLPTILVITPSR